MQTKERTVYVDAGDIRGALLLAAQDLGKDVVALRLERRPGDDQRFRVIVTEPEIEDSGQRKLSRLEVLEYQEKRIRERLYEAEGAVARLHCELTRTTAELESLRVHGPQGPVR